LYDANTLELIGEFSRHADLVKELKISGKTHRETRWIQERYLGISI